VAGIQAFSDNQAQASQDALSQKGLSVASDLQGVTGKPPQLGGVAVEDIGSGTDKTSLSQIASQIGLSGQTFDAPGAGSDAQCKLTTSGSAADTKILVTCASKDASNDVQVTFDVDGSPNKISTSAGDFSSTITPKNTN